MKEIKYSLIALGIYFGGAIIIYSIVGEESFFENFFKCTGILILLTLLGGAVLCGYILFVLCAKDAVKFTKFIIDVDEQAKKLDDDSKK